MKKEGKVQVMYFGNARVSGAGLLVSFDLAPVGTGSLLLAHFPFCVGGTSPVTGGHICQGAWQRVSCHQSDWAR